MDQSSARRDAIRVLRGLILLQLLFLGLSLVVALTVFRDTIGVNLLLRAAPTLLLAVLFLPPWLERPLGKYFLATGLGLEVLFTSLETTSRTYGTQAAALEQAGVPPGLFESLSMAPSIAPFLFVTIPLVLLAWGYGRQGALLGSTFAAFLQLGLGLWSLPQTEHLVLFLMTALMRTALLYLIPLLVAVLAERARKQHVALETAHQKLRRHTFTVEQLAVSRERARMARDLHDTLAQSLSALTVQLGALRTLLKHDPAAAGEELDEIIETARYGLQESRQAILSMRSGPVEEKGLTGALSDRLRGLQARTGIQADLRVVGQVRDLTAEEADTLFRIADGALANVERHSQAQSVRVLLEYAADCTEMTITDDGRGFDRDEVASDRYGLMGMQERANAIGAELTVNSPPAGGTRIWCALRR